MSTAAWCKDKQSGSVSARTQVSSESSKPCLGHPHHPLLAYYYYYYDCVCGPADPGPRVPSAHTLLMARLGDVSWGGQGRTCLQAEPQTPPSSRPHLGWRHRDETQCRADWKPTTHWFLCRFQQLLLIWSIIPPPYCAPHPSLHPLHLPLCLFLLHLHLKHSTCQHSGALLIESMIQCLV